MSSNTPNPLFERDSTSTQTFLNDRFPNLATSAKGTLLPGGTAASGNRNVTDRFPALNLKR